MATIPLGPGRRVQANPVAAAVQAPTAALQATQRLGAVGADIAAGQMAQATQLEAEELRKQQATAEAAERARDALRLQETEDALSDELDDLAGKIRTGEVDKAKALEQWAERSRKVVGDAMPNFAGEVPRMLAQQRLQRVAGRAERAVREAVDQKNRSDVTADMTLRLERLQREYMRDPGRAETEASALFDTLGPHSNWTPAEIAVRRQRWKEGAHLAGAEQMVMQAGQDIGRLREAAKSLNDTKSFPELEPQQRMRLQEGVASRIAQVQARAAAAEDRRLRQAEAVFKSGQALAMEGLLNPTEAAGLLQQMRGTPYEDAFSRILDAQRQAGPIAAQSVQSVRQTLDAINAEIARTGVTEQLVGQRKTLERVLSAQERDIQTKGGMRAAAERGVIVAPQPLNFSGGVPAVVDQLRNRVVQADIVKGWAGEASSPLLPEEAEALGNLLSASDPRSFGQSASMLAQVIPPEQMAAIARQIDGKNKPLALALVAGSTATTEGRSVAELIRRGVQAEKDKIPESRGADMQATMENIQKAVGDSLPGRVREDVIESARLIYLGKKAEGERVTPLGAVHLALGGPLIEHNGRRIPVPAGVDAYTLMAQLEGYPAEDIGRQAADGWVSFPGGRPMGVPEFLAALPTADLEPVGRGRYQVRIGGSLALGANRRPVVVEVGR